MEQLHEGLGLAQKKANCTSQTLKGGAKGIPKKSKPAKKEHHPRRKREVFFNKPGKKKPPPTTESQKGKGEKLQGDAVRGEQKGEKAQPAS